MLKPGIYKAKETDHYVVKINARTKKKVNLSLIGKDGLQVWDKPKNKTIKKNKDGDIEYIELEVPHFSFFLTFSESEKINA